MLVFETWDFLNFFTSKIRIILNYLPIRTSKKKQKVNLLSLNFSGAYSLQYDHTASLKNKDADLGNPNVYHSIDEMDSKKTAEHLYDEIKQNNGELEYDHLDYTGPMSAWKPHYQRMANGFGPRDGSGTSKSSQLDPELGGT